MLYFNTNKPHRFFCRIPLVLENRRSSQGEVRTPCTLPLDPPLSFLPVLLLPAFYGLNSPSDKAIPLITMNENAENGEDDFVLNPEAISMIEKLSSPVEVIAAIGDARVGKSTALNFIHYILSNDGTLAFQTKHVEEIFETGNTMEAVTGGVWISNRRMDNVILLDVEGTDLGDDTVTDKLSIFTALTSSCLTLFMKNIQVHTYLIFCTR